MHDAIGDVAVVDPPASSVAAPDAGAAPRSTFALAVGLLAWAGWVALARWRGRAFASTWKVQSVPLTGHHSVHLVPATVAVLAGGLAVAWWLPSWCARVSWRRVLAGVALLAVGWGLALALTRGPSSLDRSMANQNEYPAVVHRFEAIGSHRFIETFTDPAVLERYPIHVEGHPLGATLVFVGLDRVGLGGPWGAVWSLLAVSAVTAPAVLVAARAVAGEDVARRAAPFLVLTPSAIWSVTSADAMFAAISASAIALVVVASCRPRPGAGAGRAWIGPALAAAGGALFGLGIELSYGVVPLALSPITVAVWQRRGSVLAWAAAGGAAVVGGFWWLGFWWPDGLAATRVRYIAGIASVRPRGYWTWLGNPAAFSLALGPAVVAGVVWLRDRRLKLLVVPALVAVVVADLSGLSKAEVERIWLPFVPWIVLATASLDPAPSHGVASLAGRGRRPSSIVTVFLGAQVVLAVALESIIRTPW